MKSITSSLVAGLGLLALAPAAAMAHTDLSIGVNLGGGGYYTPQPAYVETYVVPPPVYYRSEPEYQGSRRGDAPLSHYRRHNDWVRSHPGQGGHIEHPDR